MNNAPPWIVEIEHLSRSRPVVLVEGKDDIDALEHFLFQYKPDWDRQFYLAAAGSKKRVIQGVTVHRTSWVGIIDQDEWSSLDVQSAAQQTNRLKVLPRFCIESYLCVPKELWVVLSQADRQRLGNKLSSFKKRLLGSLDDWVAHGAMWRTLHARRKGLLTDLGFPAALENQPVTDEAEIRSILQTWHDHLKPDDILDAYRQALQAARAEPEDEQLKTYVHGKKFFNQVVVQHLNRLFSGRGRSDWLQKFFDGGIQPPADLLVLLDDVLSLI